MIFHITSRTAWDDMQPRGEYRAESLSTEGFIHCSTHSQIPHVANAFFKGQTGLILLVIDPPLLSSTLRWEPPSSVTSPSGIPEAEMFPHVYGPINLNAVIKVNDFKPNPDGTFTIPSDL